MKQQLPNMNKDDLPDDIEELKNLVLQKEKEIQTQKQSLSNLAVTVVRQDKHIKALVQHIQNGKNADKQQESSLPSGGYSNSQGDTIDEEEYEDDQFHMANLLKERIDNANDFLNQLDLDQSLPYQVSPPPQPRASSPYQQISRERRSQRPPRPTASSGSLTSPLSARREQRESILSNMTRVPGHRPIIGQDRERDGITNGRAETPTRQTGLYTRQRSSPLIRPGSALNTRQEHEYYESERERADAYAQNRYVNEDRFERIPQRAMTPTEGRRQYSRYTGSALRGEGGVGGYARRSEDVGEREAYGGQFESGTPRMLNRRLQSAIDRDVRQVDNIRRSAGSAMSFHTAERIQSKRESFRFDRQHVPLEDEFESNLRIDEMDGGHIDEDIAEISTPRLARFANQQQRQHASRVAYH
eukprot:TRINITY_DN16444_c0_g1_i1.p1 TRINITY_DN16444_c0_g1~~TRINITY_DN16444_c0_g1_i1.p1  ORF type:complete len:415 (-),score=45.36 TRINITY_DN16444_c0_g1_i1:1050-2294(-)